MADPEVSLSVCIGCGFKGPEREDKVDPRPNDSGRDWGVVTQAGYEAKASTSGFEGALVLGPAPRPSRVAPGRQLPTASSAVAAETNDSTDEEEKIKMRTEGGGTWNGGRYFFSGCGFSSVAG